MGTLVADIFGGIGSGFVTMVKSIIFAFVQGFEMLIYEHTATTADGVTTYAKGTTYNTYVAFMILLFAIVLAKIVLGKVFALGKGLKSGK